MEYALYSKNLRKFYEYFEEDVTTAKECAERLGVAIPSIADELHLGRFDICLNAPVSLQEAKGVFIDNAIYTNPNGHEPQSLQSHFETGDHGKVIIRAYPVKGHTWNEEEMEAVKIFSLNVFFMCGRARLIEMMESSIVTDNSTGVCNQSGFIRYACELMAKTGLQDYHSLRFNIKNFRIVAKRIKNGHVPEVFRAYGKVIDRFLGNKGKIATLGGDNFVALVKDEVVDEFLDFLGAVPVGLTDTEEPIILSARVGVYDNKLGDNISAIMDYIDVAVATAKNTNQDVAYFKPEMLEKVLHNKAVMASFPDALANKEFVVYYQPKVSVREEELCGCEALVRWLQNGEIVPPMEFIPVLEENGAVCDLDFYVLETVCETIDDWTKREIKPVKVSVNFSKQHLKNRGVADRIIAIIDKYGVEHSLIEIELTEMSGYEDFDNLGAFVNKMRTSGIGISIDDFGTGYSSLNMLTELDVDVVKLDRSLTKCVESEYSKTKLLLLNIVDMVHKLNYKALAEGVETDEQLRFLRNIGCSMVQGFLYDKPMPKSEFEKRLTGQITYKG